MNVGIIGGGFVGNAVQVNLCEFASTKAFDIEEMKSDVGSLKDLVGWADIYFVCVPTPSGIDGACYTGYVEQVVSDLSRLDPKTPIVIKSTVPPGTTQKLAKQYGVKIGFNPEFLTEANAIEDFKKHAVIIGYDDIETRSKMYNVYRPFVDYHKKNNPYLCILEVSSNVAEMVKYASNTFLAMKVIYANQLKQLCDSVGVEYSMVAHALRFDVRLGASHWNVPGPDGQYGYGGSCFPKDTKAMINFATLNGVKFSLLEEVHRVNLEVRK